MATQPGRITPKRTMVIPDDLWEAITEQAWKNRMNISEMIRKLITDYLTEHDAMPPAPEPPKSIEAKLAERDAAKTTPTKKGRTLK